MSSSSITVDELRRNREQRHRVNHETYKQLFEQIKTRIKARANNDCTDLTWQVPPLVPGRPVFDVSHAARYISEKLRLGGFEVQVVSTPYTSAVCVLFVSWSRKRAQPSSSSQKHSSDTGSATSEVLGVGESKRGGGLSDTTYSLQRLKARLGLDEGARRRG